MVALLVSCLLLLFVFYLRIVDLLIVFDCTSLLFDYDVYLDLMV